jgi:hypothetical protein
MRVARPLQLKMLEDFARNVGAKVRADAPGLDKGAGDEKVKESSHLLVRATLLLLLLLIFLFVGMNGHQLGCAVSIGLFLCLLLRVRGWR